MNAIAVLMQRIGYAFRDETLLETALTHRSAKSNNNERMEFLGDSILSYFISIELYQRFPEATEGELSRLRASLVKGETLGKIAAELELSEYLVMGTGELKSGGYRRSSTMADAFEAIIGAIYLDGGFDAAQDFVKRFFTERLDECDPRNAQKDPKTRLQEFMQAQSRPLPEYEVVETQGKAHNQTFRVSCRVDNLQELFYGTGTSRRKAEQMAANAALEVLEND